MIEPQTAILPKDELPTSPRRWSIGTLTYTKRQLVVLFCWLLWGDFAWSMKDRSIGSVVQILLRKYHASDVLMSLFLVAFPAAVGVILGPVISFRSDRTRSRWGRRIPYLAITTPFAVVAMVCLGFSPMAGRCLHALPGLSALNLDRLVLMSMGMSWILFEVATVAANAIFGALVNDVVPHKLLGRFYGLFRALSLIAGIVFNYTLIGRAEAHYRLMFIGVGLLYGLGFAMMCIKVKEGGYPPPDSHEADGYPGVIGAARLYMKECFANPYYRWLIAAIVVSALVFLPVNLYSLPFAQTLHISMDRYGKYIALTYLISLCASYALGSLADRFHPLRTGIVAMALYAAVTLWGGFYAKAPTLYAVVFIAHGVLSGAFFTCTASLGQRLFPKMRYAQFASAAGMVGALSSIVVAPLIGSFLDASGHLYRYTYHIGCALALLAVLLLLKVQSYFTSLGGLTTYVAPE